MNNNDDYWLKIMDEEFRKVLSPEIYEKKLLKEKIEKFLSSNKKKK